MVTGRDEILNAAIKLPESDRLLIAMRLMETLPEQLPGLSEDAPDFLDELERRANDAGPTIPVSELWK